MMASSVFLVLNFATRAYWLEKIEMTKRLKKEAILRFFLTLYSPPGLHLAASQFH